MNFSWFKTVTAAALLGALSLLPTRASAELLLTENFEYTAGGLYNQGGWLHYSKNVNEPIQVVSPALTYAGYQDTETGLSAKLIGTDATTAHERLQKQFDANGITSGNVYASALINVTKGGTGGVYFMTLCQRGAKADNGIINEKTGSELYRLFSTSDGCAEGKFKLGISKNGASVQNGWSEELDLGKTYLVVMKYTFVEGANNDEMVLYINPAKGDEPTTATLTADASKADASTSMGLQGITLRQGTSSSKTGPDVTVDAIRVATEWADLWTSEGGGENPGPDPTPGDATITADNAVTFGPLYQYASDTKTITIKAEGLTEDITVSSTSADVTPAVTVIPMDEAMSANGYTLSLTFNAKTTALDGKLTLSTAGAEPVEVTLSATVFPVTPFANFRQTSTLTPWEVTYQFQGKATVTFIDLKNQRLYAQDIYGAGAMFDISMLNNPLTLKVGDRFTKAYCVAMDAEQGVTPLMLIDTPAPEVTASDVVVDPLEIEFSELSRNPEDYLLRLVTVKDVDFGSAAGSQFTTAGIAVTSASGEGRVRAFAGTDLIGTDVPAKATSVTGISTSASAAIVTMRSLADLVADTSNPAEDPAIEVEKSMTIDANEWQEINKSVEFGKLTINYANLTRPATIYVGGKDRAMFAIDNEEIPAGSGTLVVTVTYTPATTGVHSGSVTIDAMPTELSQTIGLAARAYDPENLPELSVDASGITEFEADVNGTHEQTVSFTTKNLLDYGTIKVGGQAGGAFRISSASMLKNGEQTVRVTFNPKAEGTYTETITFSADKAEPVTITVKGHTTGSAPVEDREGDEFTMAAFDTTNAHALLIEDFQNLGADSNKPFHLEGWTNAAVTGKRAWWAYKELDSDNWAAKVTAYDSKATESTDAQMILISPALDFKNAKQQLLTFRIQGKLMREGQFDNLQVIYIDPATEETAQLEATPVAKATEGSPLDKVWAEPIAGLNIPASPDYNNEWMDYVIDLKGQNIADRFFIAFGFASLRGTETTTSYLVDDFTWGRDDIAFIRPSVQILDMEASANVDNVSEPIAVEGLNLTGPITLKVQGANASKFTVEPAELPAEGGEFRIRFNSDEEGVHACFISLKADGAPESLISVEANNRIVAAIDDIITDVNDGPVDVYNMQGMLLMRGVKASDVAKHLPAGFYIIGDKKVLVK